MSVNQREQVSPHTNNYMRGGSRIKIRRKDDDENAWLDFGNVKTVTPTVNKTESEHVTGRSGTRSVDKKRISIDSIAIEIVVDEYTLRNLREWLQGSALTSVQQEPLTGITKTIASFTGAAAYTDVTPGLYYKLGKYKVDTVAFTGGAAALAEYDTSTGEGDYKVDYEMGQITFLRALTAGVFAGSVTFNCANLYGQTFSKFDVATLEVVAEGMDALEEGNIYDVWTIPQGTLAPSGGGVIDIENDIPLNWTLTQTKHPLDLWGTHTRYELAS